MNNAEKYNKLFNKYKYTSSWTIWNPDDVYDCNLFLEKRIIRNMNCNYVFVSKNPSRNIKLPWQNFHLSHRGGRDKRLASIFNDINITKKYGTCYITDFFKEEIDANFNNVGVNEKNIKKAVKDLEYELSIIGKPTIIAFGKDTYNYLNKHVNSKYYKELKMIKHFSCRLSNDKYLKEVIDQLLNY